VLVDVSAVHSWTGPPPRAPQRTMAAWIHPELTGTLAGQTPNNGTRDVPELS
jgi:hypothetical protein